MIFKRRIKRIMHFTAVIPCISICLALTSGTGIVSAGFDDLLKDVLLETTRPQGTNAYVFSPGDAVITKTGYTVYYSGYELAGDVATLLFTVFEGAHSYLVKFPSPDTITIKDVTLSIISFDNTALRLTLVQKTSQTS